MGPQIQPFLLEVPEAEADLDVLAAGLGRPALRGPARLEAQTTRAKSDANILTPNAFREGDYDIRDRVDAMAKDRGAE